MTDGSRQFLDTLATKVLIGDGAIGTELLSRGAPAGRGIERLNRTHPNLVRALHAEYIAAGSQVIETNTFGANRYTLAAYTAEGEIGDIVSAGVRLARETAPPEVFVAGSIGPLPLMDGAQLDASDEIAAFTEQAGLLVENGVDLVICETFTNPDQLERAIRVVRSLTERPIIAQLAFDEDTAAALDRRAADLVRRLTAAGANVLGANCGGGAPSVTAAITAFSSLGIPLSAFPNAGYPEQVEGRQFYLATPDYLADRAVRLVRQGVRLIGGCCGTSPITIRAIANAVAAETGHPAPQVQPRPRAASASSTVTTAKPVIPTGTVVELDPPSDLDIAPLLDGAHALREAGATTVTLADNPLAAACADAVTISGLVHHATGLAVIPHLTGRDRNRIALQSTIMGAHLSGIRAILCVTGDPVRMHQEANTSGVFDLTSVGLVQLVDDFNQGRRGGGSPTGFAIGVALNPNVRSLEGQISKLARKIEAGAHFALTQPIFDPERIELVAEALDAAGITIPLFIGILPLRSARNASFLHNEVPGIIIPETIRERLARYPDVADQRRVGTDIALELMNACAPHARGWYLIAPRNRVDLVLPILEAHPIVRKN